jgi:hypothetical protein
LKKRYSYNAIMAQTSDLHDIHTGDYVSRPVGEKYTSTQVFLAEAIKLALVDKYPGRFIIRRDPNETIIGLDKISRYFIICVTRRVLVLLWTIPK